MGWDWSVFKGSPEGLKWNRKGLADLGQALKLVPGRKLAIQAGGNLGIFPKRLAQEFEAVYSFEPSPDLFPLMCANAPEKNIIKIQAALGSFKGRVAVSATRRDGKPARHEGITHVSGPGLIPMVRLDDFIEADCDLIYLDVEGYELKALKGARQALKVHRPVVVCEVNQHIAFAGDSRAALFAFMDECGYESAESFGSDEVFRKRGA